MDYIKEMWFSPDLFRLTKKEDGQHICCDKFIDYCFNGDHDALQYLDLKYNR